MSTANTIQNAIKHLDTLRIHDTLRVHDTLFVRDTLTIIDNTGHDLITNVQTFYSDNYSHLITNLWGLGGLLFTIFAVAIPLISYFRRKLDEKAIKEKEDKLENKMLSYDKHIGNMRDEIDKTKHEFTLSENNFANQIQNTINEFTTKIDKTSSEFNITSQQIKRISITEISDIFYNLSLDLLTREADYNTKVNSLYYMCKAINVCFNNSIEIQTKHLNSLLLRSATTYKNLIDKNLTNDYQTTVMILEIIRDSPIDENTKRTLNQIIDVILLK